MQDVLDVLTVSIVHNSTRLLWEYFGSHWYYFKISKKVINDLIIWNQEESRFTKSKTFVFFIIWSSSNISSKRNSVIKTQSMKLAFIFIGSSLSADGISVSQTAGISEAQVEAFKDLQYMRLDFSAIRNDLDKSMECSCQNWVHLNLKKNCWETINSKWSCKWIILETVSSINSNSLCRFW